MRSASRSPENASLIRNIIGASQYVQDHVIHFYHLHALDWVDVTLALKADPGKTSQLAESISPWPKSSRAYFKAIQDRVKALVESKQLSLFSSGYWGHPAYHLPPEANLLAVAHYVEALELQRDWSDPYHVRRQEPPPQFRGGRMPTAIDQRAETTMTPEALSFLAELASKAQAFVDQVYIPDVLAVAGFYRDWFGRGEGLGNFLSYGDFPQGGIKDPSRFYLQRGAIFNHDLSKVYAVDPANVTEYVTHSWYDYSDGDQNGKHPYQGETSPKYTGPKPPFEHLEVDQKYSWLKAPALPGSRDGGRPAIARAGGLCLGTSRSEGCGRRRPGQTQRASNGAVFDSGTHCGSRDRSPRDGWTSQQVGGGTRRQAGARRSACTQR